MKIILALLLATTFSGGHKIENHNHNIYNGYNIISSISGVQISCPRCGEKLNDNKLCENKNCNAFGYNIEK